MSTENVLLYLLVDLFIIIVAARSAGLAARKLGQPAVIGEIVAGIVLGPTVLGRIHASWPGSLFPAQVPLKSISDLGLIFFMFLVGLELDTKLIREQGKRALQISLSGIIVPLAGGLLVGYLIYDVNNGGNFLGGVAHPPKEFAFALFIGAAMCITAFPVLARILIETGLYKTSVGTATLCAAAVDDVSAWILLAAVVGITRTGSVGDGVRTLLLVVAFLAFMLTIGRRLLQLVERRYEATGRLSVDLVALVLAGVVVAAFATEKFGAHYIFGAFILGAVMPKRSHMTAELSDKVEDFTVVVLLPVFFLINGLRTNLFTLNSPSLVGWLLLILAVAMAGKFLGCGLAARLTGSDNRDAVVIGALMNTRGLTELVILSVGLSLGVLSDRTFAMMVMMALVTTVLAAPIVNKLMPRAQRLRELAQPEGVGARPAAARVLVILGNPLNAHALVDTGVRLTGATRPVELLLVRLIPTSRAPQFRSGLQEAESAIDASVESMHELVAYAEAAGVSARPLSFLTDDLTADVIRLATDQHSDTIVSGWHRASVELDVIRTSVHRIFREAPCEVVVLVDREGHGILPGADRPVVAVVTAGANDAAVEQVAGRLAQSLGSNVRLVGYMGEQESPSAPAASEALARDADALRRESGAWVVPQLAEREQLVATAGASADTAAVVIGVGNTALDGVVFGEPASAVAAQARCPVLIVRGAGQAGAMTAASWQSTARSALKSVTAGRG